MIEHFLQLIYDTTKGKGWWKGVVWSFTILRVCTWKLWWCRNKWPFMYC